jgi:WD40 repeat protein
VEGHEHEAKSVAWNRGGTLLATCSRDKSVWIWECLQDNDFECLSVLHGHEQDVKFVRFHPREDVLFSASYDDTIKVWEEEDDDWACVATLKGHTSTVWGLAVGSRDDGLVSCSDDASLLIWKRAGGEGEWNKWRNVAKLSNYHTATVYSVDWSRESGAIVSGAADDSIRVFIEDPEQPQGWAMDSPSFICDTHKVKAHEGDVNCVRWNPTAGKAHLLASAGDDQVVRLWTFRRSGE